jgi:predicted acyltransferase
MVKFYRGNPVPVYDTSLFVNSLFSLDIGGQSADVWIADQVFISRMGGYLGSLGFALWIMLTCWSVG